MNINKTACREKISKFKFEFKFRPRNIIPNAMVNLFGYAQRYYQEKQDTKALTIKRSRLDSSKSHINYDDSNLVKTNTWTLLLRDINDLECALPNQKRHYKAYLTTY